MDNHSKKNQHSEIMSAKTAILIVFIVLALFLFFRFSGNERENAAENIVAPSGGNTPSEVLTAEQKLDLLNQPLAPSGGQVPLTAEEKLRILQEVKTAPEKETNSALSPAEKERLLQNL
jgi:hypothetical protein